ncbi:alpha/beta fold hydrolase [Saccharothrix sp. S26]|uniref:thioesterase II family protein n=1 Tax=Saccharothrix sp. S26 TaxID=2907215 RepID=UPI001F371916|nr:alpha/beta fold hydrolase [Saccharothrix sp. S26]MCE6999218.1 alpha/beta fold hydrolase [Saccharothrix sp. S26]
MTARLVCLPFGGAGASFFRPWSAIAGDRLEVVPVQLPGRERQIDLDPYTDVHEAVTGLLPDLLAQLDGSRVVLFGHSLGAVLAHELAHRLLAAPGVELLRLVVSGSPAPGVRRELTATGLADDDEFLARVKQIAGYAHEALDDPEMRELILPTLRADVEMHETYVPSTEEPLAVPITAVRGVDDALVSADEAAGWAKVTSRDFELVEVPGGHMYLTDSAPALLDLIHSTVH